MIHVPCVQAQSCRSTTTQYFYAIFGTATLEVLNESQHHSEVIVFGKRGCSTVVREHNYIYFAKDMVDDGFVPKNKKPKPIPKPLAIVQGACDCMRRRYGQCGVVT